LEEKQTGAGQTALGSNQLEVLKSMSVVVADTGEPELVKKFKPVDCTTNPSLVYKAVQEAEYQPFLMQALQEARNAKGPQDPNRPYAGVADVLSTIIGAEMLKIVPGRVSTEVDAHLSYDSKATYDKAMRLMDLYSCRGIGPDRVYIKLASTWEGVEACRKLQKQGVDCNMTLLFSFGQAAACADAGAALISPFVGRILDWHKAKHKRDFSPAEDPGVDSVRRIYTYYKTHGYNTVVMAASFRNKGEITELAGCDKITISPQLLAELQSCAEPLPRKLSPDMINSPDSKVDSFSTDVFNKLHGADEMAVDKLKQGIDGFAADQKKLEEQLAKLAGGRMR
jgi:transaldolase